jgi:DNA modification methylase
LLINGDSLIELAKLPDNSVDLVVTDPPYGYSFMGKEWDKALPDKRIWKECLRVLKHGGFAYVMSAPRQDVLSRMMIDLEDSGFNIGFTSMYWAYATGFPKALNISKAIDKKLGVKPDSLGIVKGMGKQNSDWNGKGVGGRKEDYFKPEYEKVKATSEQAKKMDGSYAGFQPKPAVEVIIVCMKPLEEKGYIDQALANGKGVSWFDDCRIPYESEDDSSDVDRVKTCHKKNSDIYGDGEGFTPTSRSGNNQGRYPANLLVSDNAVDTGEIKKTSAMNSYVKGKQWNTYGKMYDRRTVSKADSGDFSRYFDIDKWWEAQFIITPKASKSEKNKGLDDFEEKFQANAEFRPNHLEDAKNGSSGKPHGRYTATKNNHPTVKPLKLMSYLITLGSREGDIVLDPFMGSGTTPLASKQLNRKYIGIELDEDYFKICKARVEDC